MEELEQGNKYYTPTIDEFYVGFEYEFKTLKGWELRIFNSDDGGYYNNVCETKEGISDGNIRVKYLDKEDIESFGFEYLDDGKDVKKYTCYIKGEFVLYDYNYYGDDNSEGIRIFKSNPKYSDPTFVGVIKNKSELKKLLNQLNIIENE